MLRPPTEENTELGGGISNISPSDNKSYKKIIKIIFYIAVALAIAAVIVF